MTLAPLTQQSALQTIVAFASGERGETPRSLGVLRLVPTEDGSRTKRREREIVDAEVRNNSRNSTTWDLLPTV